MKQHTAVTKLQRWWHHWRAMRPSTNGVDGPGIPGCLRYKGQCVVDPLTLSAIPVTDVVKLVTPTGHVRAFEASTLYDYLLSSGKNTCPIDRSRLAMPQIRAIARGGPCGAENSALLLRAERRVRYPEWDIPVVDDYAGEDDGASGFADRYADEHINDDRWQQEWEGLVREHLSTPDPAPRRVARRNRLSRQAVLPIYYGPEVEVAAARPPLAPRHERRMMVPWPVLPFERQQGRRRFPGQPR